MIRFQSPSSSNQKPLRIPQVSDTNLQFYKSASSIPDHSLNHNDIELSETDQANTDTMTGFNDDIFSSCTTDPHPGLLPPFTQFRMKTSFQKETHRKKNK
jgi:hypothetical protein